MKSFEKMRVYNADLENVYHGVSGCIFPSSIPIVRYRLGFSTTQSIVVNNPDKFGDVHYSLK